MLQNTRQQSFLIHAGTTSVVTICVLFSSSHSCLFSCMPLGFTARGYGLAAPSVRISQATLIAWLVNLVWYVFVGGVTWLLGRGNFDCIWLVHPLPLLHIEVGWQELDWNKPYLCLSRGACDALLYHCWWREKRRVDCQKTKGLQWGIFGSHSLVTIMVTIGGVTFSHKWILNSR